MIIALITSMLYINDVNNINNSFLKNDKIQEISVKELDYKNITKLEDIDLSNEYTIVKFTADWCTYCKKMEKDIFKNEEFNKSLSNYKINVVDLTETDENKELIMSKFKVVAPPALFFFKEGKPIHYKVGEMKKDEMFEVLEKIK